MSVFAHVTESKEELLDLIQCQWQPGWLRISRQACVARYLRANNRHSTFPNNDFGMALQSSLAICRACPEGHFFSTVMNGNSLTPKRKSQSKGKVKALLET